ncbi:MAG TPA: DUF4279 domain-containing protein [Steroidobacteraceae bacterium]|jgi:hypothetical protein
MSDYEFTIALCIRHPTIDPSRITDSLGIEPQHTWKAGEPRCDAAGAELEGVYRESYWTGLLMAEPQMSSGQVSVERVLEQMLLQLRRAQDFLVQLNAEGGLGQLVVSVFARGVLRLDLSPGLLASLGRLGLSVALDIHPHLPQHTAASAPN